MTRYRFSRAWPLFVLALGLGHCETDSAKSNSQSPSGDLTRIPLAVTPAVPTLQPMNWHTSASPKLDSMIRSEWVKSKMGGRLGVSVYSTKYGRAEVSLNDSEWFTPASCLKLIVTAATLDTFPINHFPLTSLEVYGKIVGHTLHGHLVAVGGGDPNFSDRFFPDALSPLKPFADSLRQMGIDTVVGTLTTVDTFFTSPRRPAAWKAHHFNTWYGAEIASLSYQDNTFTLTVMPSAKPSSPPVVLIRPNVGYVQVINKARTTKGRGRRLFVKQDPDTTRITLTGTLGTKGGGLNMILPVRNPAAYFRAALLHEFGEDSIQFLTSMAHDTFVTPVHQQLLIKRISLTTAPLYDMIEEVNQKSQNLHAESLLRHLGAYVEGDGSDTSGLKAEHRFFRKMGIDTNGFLLKDGCGLSPDNRIKPRAITALLAAMARHRYHADYIASLATPGMDGATGKRLRPWSDSHMIRYKTGSINRVQGLSGYAFGIDGDTLALALFANDFRGAPEKASRLLDSIFVKVANWVNLEREAVIAAHKLLTRPDAPVKYADRLRYFSKALEGTPYFLGPTGEGRFASLENKPIFDLSRFDCVTYIESVMGLSMAHTARDVLPVVMRLRYRNDTVAYTTRNHYFVADWMAQNARYVRQFPMPGDTVVERPINKIKFFADKGLPGPVRDPVLTLRYLPYAKAVDLMEHWNLGAKFLGVAFVTDIPGLDVTHTGFLVSDAQGRPQLRHASQLKGFAATQDFGEYLNIRKGKVSGIVFFEFLEP